MSLISQPFGPLCEGFDPDLRVEVGWVQQGNKVCFLLGERSLCESTALLEGTTLVESIDELDCIESLDERTGRTTKHVKDGRWFVEGPFQRSDVKNANHRFYPRVIWEKQVGDSNSNVQKTVREGGMLGHLEHPKDGRTDGNEGAMVSRKLTLRPDGVVWGVAELLDTPKGLILQEYTRKGVRWGVSSRGNGSVDDTGRVNENDYVLEAFDGVMKPSTPGAYPKTTADSRTESAAAPNEESEAAVEAPREPSSVVTEDVRALRSEIEALCETDLIGLDPKDRLAFTRELVAGLGRVNSLAGSNAIPEKDATDLRDWLTIKLQAVHESEEVEQTIEEAVGVDPDDADDAAAEAFKRVVSSLQARNEDLARECAQVREELQRTQRAKVAVQQAAESQIAALKAQQETAGLDTHESESELALASVRKELEDTQQRLAEVEAQLRVANSLVSDTYTVDVRNPVEEAVADALRAHPALVEFQTALRGAESPEQVQALVERLTAERPSAVPLTRRALPVGVLAESSADAGKRTAGANPSRGARMAGAVVQRMHGSASKLNNKKE